jgi:hypothetical protein
MAGGDRSVTAVRVGVTGHRVPPKLPESAMAPTRLAVDRLLMAIGAIDGGERVVVSSLAEGADRIVAAAGLAAGWRLEAVLPFDRVEYARDFSTPASIAEFDGLLQRAALVLELPGEASDRPPAYRAAGRRMLEDADLLIAIWDGQVAEGIGGSAEIIGNALAEGTPVAWIEPAAPSRLRLSRPGIDPATPVAEAFHPVEPGAIAAALAP